MPGPTASASAGIPDNESGFFLVYQTTSQQPLRVNALPGGAILTGGSLLALVVGTEIRQDPAWLVGLPEIVNWDVNEWVVSLPQRAQISVSSTLPIGLHVAISAGNRHGPFASLKRTQRGWLATKGPAADRPSPAQCRALIGVETPDACAVTSDGALWVVAKGKLWHHTANEPPRALALPGNPTPRTVAAAKARVWVVTDDHRGQQVFSNEPVSTPASADTWQMPLTDFSGISGLDVQTVDVPNVSSAPAGPGTQACSRLVVWLGATLSPAMAAALNRLTLGADTPIVLVTAAAPGMLVIQTQGQAQLRLAPSGESRSAVAALPNTFAVGKRMVQALRELKPSPRLLCANPVIRAEVMRLN